MKTRLVVAVMALLMWSVTSVAQTTPKGMALIPSGEFEMGDALDKTFLEVPVHTVFVDSFLIDTHEVSKKLWDEVLLWAQNHNYDFDNKGTGRGLDHPVHTINWYDAIKWCNARSEKEGRTPAYYTSPSPSLVYRQGRVDIRNEWVRWNSGYRLPTEAEWEKAARGGLKNARFPWGNTITHAQANYNSEARFAYDISATRGYHPTYKSNDYVTPATSPIGSFPPEYKYGMFDMMGNVREWCFDWFGPYYYNDSPKNNPRGPSVDLSSLRIIKGGDWLNHVGSARVSSRYGWNTTNAGFGTGFRVVLSPAWIEIIEQQPKKPTYSPGPEKLPGKDSLIVVTHGWQPKWETPQMDWVTDATNLITQHLKAKGLDNWQVHAHDWMEKAHVVFADSALERADEEGKKLGQYLSDKNFDHIHFIAHSAGSALIQAAIEKIKENNRRVVIHSTFLDAYVGVKYGGKNRYGQKSDWSEHYYSVDKRTVLTDKILANTINVDVTFIDPNKFKLPVGAPAQAGGYIAQTCFQTVSSHDWPHDFYIHTITKRDWSEARGFGFSLAREGGDWNTAMTYNANSKPIVLGKEDPTCLGVPGQKATHSIPAIDFSKADTVKSPTGIVTPKGTEVILQTGSPVWVTIPTQISTQINFVSFEATFAGNKECLLSAYWDTNIIGSIDGSLVPPAVQKYTFVIPTTSDNGKNIGFRLDSFSNVPSQISINNVVLGYIGSSESFSLSYTGIVTNRTPVFELKGQKGITYSIESSVDLVNWTAILLIGNVYSSAKFSDPEPSVATKFYRAVIP